MSGENRFVTFRIVHKPFVCMVWLVDNTCSVLYLKAGWDAFTPPWQGLRVTVLSYVCPSLCRHLIVPDRCQLIEWINGLKHWWWQAFASTGLIRVCTHGKVHLRLPYMCLNLPASSWGSAQAAAGWLLLPYLHCCWNRNVQAEIHDATRALAAGTQLLGSPA